MRASRSFQLPSGRIASQITTEILESIRCSDACSQSCEYKTAIGEDPFSSIPARAAVRFNEGETTRTVSVAACAVGIIDFALSRVGLPAGDNSRRGSGTCLCDVF